MYLQTDEILELLWRGSSALTAEDVQDEDEEDSPVPRRRRHEAAPRLRLNIPQTAVFQDGHLVSWYFSKVSKGGAKFVMQQARFQNRKK